MTSPLTSTGFDSSSFKVELVLVTSGICLGGGLGEGSWLGELEAKRTSNLLGSFKATILLGLAALLVRAEVGGVETLARLLETRRDGFVAFEVDGMMARMVEGYD